MFVIYSLLCMNLRYNSQYYEDSKSDGLIKPSLLTPYNACPHSEQNFAPLIFRYPQFVQNTIPLISKSRVVKEFRFLSTSSAISSALSSSLDCCTIPQICVISTGQKNSIEMIVGIACCPKIPIPASNAIALSLGIKLTFNADFKPVSYTHLTLPTT